MRTRDAFTLIELLVVISIIALLIGILLPVLSNARHSAKAMACTSNMRQLALAHSMYQGDHDGRFVKVGLAHGGAHGSEPDTWVKTLQTYWGSRQDSGLGPEIQARSPLDDSPHWPGGTPVPPTTDQYRRTSYALNDLLTEWGDPAERKLYIQHVPSPSATAQFLIAAFEGSFAGTDHLHIANWYHPTQPIPARAAAQSQINAVAGEETEASAVSNYAYLDGHVAAESLDTVFVDLGKNRFFPNIAR